MVLKDWKKDGECKWIEKRKGHIQNTIYIDRRQVPISYFGTKTELLYGIHIGYDVVDGSNVVDRSEYFKTKSQALKFAKSYMRTH